MNNFASEHVLLGQLLTSATGALTYDANRYFGQEGDELIELSGDAAISWTTLTGQTIAGASGLFNLTTFTADVTEGQGPLTLAEPGRALVLKQDYVISGVTYSQHVFEIVSTSVVDGSTDGLPHPSLPAPAFQQTLVAIYVGSYNNSGTNDTGATIPNTASRVPEDLLLSNFNAREAELLSLTSFNDFSSSMWGEKVSAEYIREGYFPRSGRLNFTSGVNYEFYGSPEVGNEHFHMILQTEGDLKRSHWWMGRLSNDAEYLATDKNSTGMFLGTSGPHTDEQGVDTYQYPFAYRAANEVYKNPCTVTAAITNDGLVSTVRQKDGGRLGYGPTGANHQRKYGPNETKNLFLQSQAYSIQSGFNSFEGSEALSMTGARSRTFFPLRVGNPSAFGFYSDYHISPWAPVEAVLHGLPMPTARASIQTEDAILEAEGIANLVTATGGTALAASGWAEQQFSGVDPQTHFWRANGADGLAHAANATYDRIEFRVRLKTPAVGGTLASSGQGQIFITNTANTSFGAAGNSMLLPHPASFAAGEWTTYSIDPSAMAGWATTITGLRVDMFHYGSAPTTGMRLEWDYISVGQTRLQRNSMYAYNNGGYAIHLGQFPGVGRITLFTGIASFEPDSAIVTEAGNFDSAPVTIRGTAAQYQRPLDPTDHSGLAGYVYER